MPTDWYSTDRWLKAPRPGGQVELGERLSEAVVREVLEESGIRIRVTGFCGIYQTVTRSICNLLFAGGPIGGALRASAESLEVGWVPTREALARITYGNFRESVRDSLDPGRWPFLVEYHE